MLTDTYAIDKNIPMPAALLGKYDWGRLAVGDSLFVPAEGRKPRAVRDTVRNCARSYGRRHEKLFRAKTLVDGVRVWRIL